MIFNNWINFDILYSIGLKAIITTSHSTSMNLRKILEASGLHITGNDKVI